MTNAEWAIEHKPGIFRGFSCPECSNSTDELVCGIEHGKWSESDCANGHMEWLMQPHESVPDGERGPVSVSDECEPAKEESGPVTDADSRERLEADASKWCVSHAYGETGYRFILELLDRQTAITRRETVTECDRLKKHDELAKKVCELADYLVDIACALGIEWDCLNIPSDDEIYEGVKQRIRELRKTNGTLCQSLMDAEHERDDLKERIAELKNRRCPGYEPENHRCRWHDADFELNTTKLIELKRENAKLKKRIDELNHAENATETPVLAENPQKTPEQQRICDTCRWFGGYDDGYLGECHRYPSVVDKMPDDLCGEWS